VPHRDAGRPEHRPHRCALATYARVNEFGFIETPYRKVTDGKVTSEIATPRRRGRELRRRPGQTPLNADGTFLDERVLVRRSPQAASLQDLKLQLERDVFFGATTDIASVPAEVQLMDVSPKQIVSVAAALIPFLEHDDANRALMGANMQRRPCRWCVPRRRTSAPASSPAPLATPPTSSPRTTARSPRSMERTITVSTTRRVASGLPPAQVPSVPTRTPASTSGAWPPARRSSKGDILADGPSTDNGELALGKNLLVAFMPWEGYNFEDAIILSERLVKDDVLTSIHIHEHEVDARDTKLGPEEITRDIPNLSDEILADLDERGIIRVGAEVGRRRRAGRQGHPQGRDRADPRGAPAARHLR
jgi:DNA-directed RNA polymerase subunit beta